MFTQAEDIATQNCAVQTQLKITEMTRSFNQEIQRLKSLQQENPKIRDDESSSMENQKKELNTVMKKAHARLDSSRLIVAG